jgi:hypothetical protein
MNQTDGGVTVGRREFLAGVAGVPLAARRQAVPAKKVTVQNRYYAKPGRGDEVYEWRQRVCDIIERLGSPRGVVFRGRGGDEPDAIWQVELPDRESARRMSADITARPEFKTAEAHMATLIRRFESSLWEDVRPAIVG